MSWEKSTIGVIQSNITQRVKAAAVAGRVIVTTHAMERALERGITRKQLEEVAKSGMQTRTEPPAKKGLNPKTRMTKQVAGDEVTIIATVKETKNAESAVIISDWTKPT